MSMVKQWLQTVNEVFSRSTMGRILDNDQEKYDINENCGYPDTILTTSYRELWEREGIPRRVVNIMPEESWALDPVISSTTYGDDESEFDKELDSIDQQFGLYQKLLQADTLSGIGRFGVILLGLNDGKSLDKPVAGINKDGSVDPDKRDDDMELLYIRSFDETAVTVSVTEGNKNSPRYSLPLMYTLKYAAPASTGQDPTKDINRALDVKVHWTRLIHIADNREMSEVYGTPRMQPIYNRLIDIRKILSSSGEMFWNGAFPGYALEMDPKYAAEAEIDLDGLKTEVDKWTKNVDKRMLFLNGISAKSLAPQVSNPNPHLAAQLSNVAITLGVPLRLLMGAEAGKLASTQDAATWTKRLNSRREGYVTPYIIRVFIDRLVAIGVLPEDEYTVVWPDLSNPSEVDQADVANTMTEALAKYVAGGVYAFMQPEEYFSIVWKMEPDVVKKLVAGVDLSKLPSTITGKPDDSVGGGQPTDPAATKAEIAGKTAVGEDA